MLNDRMVWIFLVHQELQWYHSESMFFSGIFVCSQSGDHPQEDVRKWGPSQEDLSKYGNNWELKYKSLIILLHFWLHNDKPKIRIWTFSFFSHFWQLKTSKNHFFFRILILIFVFFGNKFASEKKGEVNILNIKPMTPVV